VEDRLIENAERLGRVLSRELEKLKQKHPSVGDVRAIGLFSIVELVKDRKTREPLVPYNARLAQMQVMNQINKFFREHGLYTFIRWNNFFVNPPLCITEEQLMEGLGVVDAALEISDRAVA